MYVIVTYTHGYDIMGKLVFQEKKENR